MALLVALVRHGVTDWNEQGRVMGRSDVALNPRGRAQAEAAAAALADLALAAVVASPQRRAQETAAAIAAARGITVHTDPDLADVWVGAWQGRTAAELRGDPDVLRYLADPTHPCEHIEPASAVQQRMLAVWGRLRAGTHGDRVCVVSHGDPLRLLLAHCLGMALPEFRRLHVAPGSISVVRVGSRGTRVLALNWRPARMWEW